MSCAEDTCHQSGKGTKRKLSRDFQPRFQGDVANQQSGPMGSFFANNVHHWLFPVIGNCAEEVDGEKALGSGGEHPLNGNCVWRARAAARPQRHARRSPPDAARDRGSRRGMNERPPARVAPAPSLFRTSPGRDRPLQLGAIALLGARPRQHAGSPYQHCVMRAADAAPSLLANTGRVACSSFFFSSHLSA